MAIDYDRIMQLKIAGAAVRYTDRDVMLYALGVGFGRNPMALRELKFVYENDLKTVPTFATVIGFGLDLLTRSGIDVLKAVHGEQRLTLHKPLPCEAEVVTEERITGVVDKGEGNGALLLGEKTVFEKKSGDKLCTLGATVFARGDGGFGGPNEGVPVPHLIPAREPDKAVEFETRPDQALLYALSGDRNPLHRDPLVARMAGYKKPVLHGLCTYGMACRAVLAEVCDYDPARIAEFDCRFSAPLTPGDSIVTQIWVDGPVVSFRCKLKDRGLVILDNGRCLLRA